MEKAFLIILVSILLVGCGYEWKKKDTEPRTKTVFITEIGNFAVKGEIEFHNNGRIEFEDQQGRIFTTHISRCIIVDTAVPKAQVNKPAPPPVKKTEESKDKPTKVPNKGK